MDDGDLIALAWCKLLVDIIARAVKDARGGKLCNSHCRDGEHICSKDALDFLSSSGVAFILDSLGVDPGEIREFLRRNRKESKAMKKTDDAKESKEQPTTRHCKLCEQDIALGEWGYHLFYQHSLTEAMYDEYEPGQPRSKTIETTKIERVPPPPPPPPLPPETMVEIRLVNCESNPPTAGVEARRGCSYFFEKGKWQAVPIADARLLLPDELFPGTYSNLRFERKPEKQQGKARK